MLKTIVQDYLMNRKKNHLFEIEVFCKNAKVVTVTFFNQFNASVLNKSIHLFPKNLLTPNIWMVLYIGKKIV